MYAERWAFLSVSAPPVYDLQSIDDSQATRNFANRSLDTVSRQRKVYGKCSKFKYNARKVSTQLNSSAVYCGATYYAHT